MAVKPLEGMPTIQSAVGILLGTFAVIGKREADESSFHVIMTFPAHPCN